ncbi:hypothetical protein [Acinetobacter defluvii]|uniref:hypothetical protein n=1 Tax=Acinetobacter defluvii TaxID=1871111 RepID=UPI003AF6FBFE
MNLKKIAFTLFLTSIMSSAWADDAVDAAVAAADEAIAAANDATSTEAPTTEDTTDTTAIDAPVIDDAAE